MRGVRVLLLGQGRIEFDGQPLTRLMASKHQALVFYLAATDEPALRSRLAALLWGDNDEVAAHANLRVALTRLRRWLPDMLDIDNRQVAFAADAKVSVDLRDLTQALQYDAPLAVREAAAAAWRGPLLDGLDVVGSDEFERWLTQMRQRAQRDALALRRALLQSHEADGALDAAIDHARADAPTGCSRPAHRRAGSVRSLPRRARRAAGRTTFGGLLCALHAHSCRPTYCFDAAHTRA
jgi:DNA-binding SARP family transcriptional activator